MEKGLLEKTGKSLEQWVDIAQSSGLEKHGQIVNYLKTEHGLTHGYANLVTLTARSSHAAAHDDSDLVEMQYKGKEGLKPIYDKIVEAVLKFGADVEIAPKKASVSLRRKRQFALVQPSTKTRVDLGLKFNDRDLNGRLEGSGPFGAMCTHRIKLGSPDDVDEEVMAWIRDAYDEAQ